MNSLDLDQCPHIVDQAVLSWKWPIKLKSKVWTEERIKLKDLELNLRLLSQIHRNTTEIQMSKQEGS